MSGHHAKLSGPRWAAARRTALESSGWRCERCGRSGRLEVHHRTPLHRGGDPYAEANLLVLCRRCHIDVHRPQLTPAEAAWKRLIHEMSRT